MRASYSHASVGCQDSERGFSTWRRLPQELRLRKITTAPAANRFLRDEYMKEFNRPFSVKASERGTAFVPLRRKELDLVFSLQHERVVACDNTVSFGNRVWQLESPKLRATLAGCTDTTVPSSQVFPTPVARTLAPL